MEDGSASAEAKPRAHAHDNDGAKSDACDVSSATDLTSLSSGDGGLDDSSSSSRSSPSQPTARQQGRKKSVRFSCVSTREYNVVEIPPDDDEVYYRRSLGWDYTERESDVETHLDESSRARKEAYLHMIQNHIDRVESGRREGRGDEARRKKKERGFKSRVLKPLWKGFIEMGNRSGLAIPSLYESPR